MDIRLNLNFLAVESADLAGQVDGHRDAAAVAVGGQATDELVQSFMHNGTSAVHGLEQQ